MKCLIDKKLKGLHYTSKWFEWHKWNSARYNETTREITWHPSICWRIRLPFLYIAYTHGSNYSWYPHLDHKQSYEPILQVNKKYFIL